MAHYDAGGAGTIHPIYKDGHIQRKSATYSKARKENSKKLARVICLTEACSALSHFSFTGGQQEGRKTLKTNVTDGEVTMLKKTLITAIFAGALMAGAQAPASAAMKIAPPAATETDAASNIVDVRFRGRGGFRRGGFGRFRGHGFRRFGRFRHRGWRHRGWRHRGWHWRKRHWKHYRWKRHGHWSWYRQCKWKQAQGYRIYCPHPYY